MIEDILKNRPNRVAVCFLTNLYTKNNGNAVLGDKISKLFLKYFPNLDKEIGKINKSNQKVFEIKSGEFSIINFPVKSEYFIAYKDLSNVIPALKNKTFSGDILPGWASLFFDEYIVKKSCSDLFNIQNNYDVIYFILSTEDSWDNINNKILYKNLKKYIDLSKLKFIKYKEE